MGTDNASLDIYSGQIKSPTATWILSIGVWHLGATRDAALKFPYGGARFAKHVEKYIIELKDGKAILSTVLLTDRDIGKLVANG